MSSNEREYVVVFASHNGAITIYNKLLKKGYKVEIIPTPCTISPSCTKSLKCKEEYLQLVKDYLKEYKIVIRGIYEIVRDKKNLKYIKII
ncbi:DUF3343 domain-containing protein [Clostridium rectalis]|uniref:DUF3343 domain-containing protein n=1 Tax=Clostridium rectalis TaxID=2040295 RepID=UPI000F62C8D9|nr:DUF3343 domain-containing protein [Clostridium rectalis]